MKILGFIFLLLVVLYFSRNQEGFNDKQINEDIKEFNYLFDQAKNENKSKSTTKLKNLNFVNGSGNGKRLDELIDKYANGHNNKKDVSKELTLDETLEKLRFRKDND
jgi:hypothetical protein